MMSKNNHLLSRPKFISCNGLGINPLQLLFAYFKSFLRIPGWVQLENREVIYTYQGRNAIALLIKIINLGLNDEVIAPAYNCGAEIDPFIQAGAKVILYDIDFELKIDPEKIKRLVTGSTRIVYITHFFGWPQNIDELACWCKKKGIFIVEDCAQALYSCGPNNTIGRFGTAAIYSFVKTLPSPDGGALVVDKNLWKDAIRYFRPQFKYTLQSSMPLFKKWFMNSTSFWQKFEATRNLFVKSWRKNKEKKRDEPRPAMLKSNYFAKHRFNWTMSRVSKGIIQSAKKDVIIKKRRQNFLYLLSSLCNVPGFKPVFSELPDGVCPMAFPFTVKDRQYWYAELDTRGIMVQGWPGYYPGFNWGEYPQSCNLKDNLLTLPLHQYLELRHMDYMAACIREIAERKEES